MKLLTASTAALVALAAGSSLNAQASDDAAIQSAMSAAPTAVSANATVIAPQADGSMKTLRKGSNGWTCLPDAPETPGPDPMCMDANGVAWAQAMMAHKAPPANAVGLGYMLQGGVDASNTDPFVSKPAAGADWVRTGPHMMVFGADSLLKLYPSAAKPDTSAPYVMWAGTPYAHLMVPVANPAQPAGKPAQ